MMLRGLVAVLLLAAAGGALAERLPLGTMKTQSCRAHLYLDISAPQFRRVAEELKFCAERGVKAATLPGLIRNHNAAASRFWQEFQQCSRYVEWDDAELAVERSCRN